MPKVDDTHNLGPDREGSHWESDSLAAPDGDAWDLLVIGGGTAGIVAAKTAARFGASVILIERQRTGGDCLWTGCVPSKSLLSAAHAAADARRAGRLGVHVEEVRVDFAEVMQHIQSSIAKIEPVDSPASLREVGASVYRGEARFAGSDTAIVDGSAVRFRQALLATGAAPVEPPIPGLSTTNMCTNESIFSIDELPSRLLVLGGGSIGCELGQAFSRLGSSVTIIEAAQRLLIKEDVDAAEAVTAALVDDGVDIRTGVSLSKVGQDSGRGIATLGDGSTVSFDLILVAVGRRPRTDNLGLTQAGVETDERGFVKVDTRLRTTNRRIRAAGDLTGHPQFTHTAGVHGSIAASNAVLGLRRTVGHDVVPRVTFTQPEIAAFGVGIQEARDRGWRLHTVLHDEVDRAITEANRDGFTRLIFGDKGRIVGATIVGPRAGESLAELVLAKRQGIRASALAGSMHAYPTYSDGVWKAAINEVQQQLEGRVVKSAVRALLRIRRGWLSIRARG